MPSSAATLAPPTPRRPGPATRSGLLDTAAALPEMRWAAAATGLFVLGGVLQLVGAAAWSWWALYLTCSVTGGWEPTRAGLEALRAKTLDVDLLMVVAAVLAASIGQVFDGALLIVIFATSGALEALATRRTEDSVRALLDLAPEQATRLTGPGASEQVDAAELRVGDLILVRPGELIGADGRVTEGSSDVDQATITGEPLPIARTAGDEVFAGTLNGSGALTVRVGRAAADTVVARIVALVQEASATKARTQLFVETVEQRYSVGVVAATLALFAVPLLLGADLQPTLLRAMTFMIVASPCAVVLATMPPLLATIANAGRHGVLIKSAVALEQLGRVGAVAFDKTGTLTHGAPHVVHVEALARSTQAEVLRLAATVEHRSEHPLAAAVVRAAEAHGIELGDARDFASTAGRGVVARVDGHEVAVGSPALVTDIDVRNRIRAHEKAGLTVVVLLVDGRPHGLILLQDRVRAEAADTVASLRALTGTSTTLLTGDNRDAAARLAHDVGLDRFEAELLPRQKVDALTSLSREGHAVMLIGDGVNDAPAMAAADVGVAMGRHGSDLALETADVILVHDTLDSLPPAIALARRSARVVRANLAFAATVIAVLVLWDLVGTLPLPLGVAGHEGSTIVVALNGLRLLRPAAWPQLSSSQPRDGPVRH